MPSSHIQTCIKINIQILTSLSLRHSCYTRVSSKPFLLLTSHSVLPQHYSTFATTRSLQIHLQDQPAVDKEIGKLICSSTFDFIQVTDTPTQTLTTTRIHNYSMSYLFKDLIDRSIDISICSYVYLYVYIYIFEILVFFNSQINLFLNNQIVFKLIHICEWVYT